MTPPHRLLVQYLQIAAVLVLYELVWDIIDIPDNLQDSWLISLTELCAMGRITIMIS